MVHNYSNKLPEPICEQSIQAKPVKTKKKTEKETVKKATNEPKKRRGRPPKGIYFQFKITLSRRLQAKISSWIKLNLKND